MATPDTVTKTTPDVVRLRIAKLRALFPETVTEGEDGPQVDFDRLRATLGDLDALADNDAYTFTWAGKQTAFRAIQTPSAASLQPVPDESVNWETTKHLFIEGENLEVLKLLYKSYVGKVKMIYIDPPYNTGNDFIYKDDYRVPLKAYLEKTGQVDAESNVLTSNPETRGRYHSDWLTMMYPRLFLARQLLREDGVIFVSIDDNEVHHLRLLMNEVFGEENFVATVIWQKMDSPSRNDAERAITDYHDYILLYARNKALAHLRQKPKPGILEAYPFTLPNGRPARRRQLRKNGKEARREDRPSMWYPLIAPDGTTVYPVAPEGWEGRWVLSHDTWQQREAQGLTAWVKRDYGWVPYYVETAPEDPTVPWPTLWTTVDQNRQAKAEYTAIMGAEIDFDSPKPTSLIRDMLRMTTSPGDIVMDFFSGSGTTAEAILNQNRADGADRRFILVQIPERTTSATYPSISDIGKERVRRAIGKLKTESDASAVAAKTDDGPQLALALADEGKSTDDIDRVEANDLGFKVFRLAPSAFRHWTPPEDADPEALEQQLSLFDEGLKDDADPRHVLYEVIVKEGYSLNSEIETLTMGEATVYRVTDEAPGGEDPKGFLSQEATSQDETKPLGSPATEPPSFFLCLNDAIDDAVLDALPLDDETVFICQDAALDDSQKVNLSLQCVLKTI